MAKHAKKSDHLQLVDLPKTTTVEISLPLLGAFGKLRPVGGGKPLKQLKPKSSVRDIGQKPQDA